MEDQFVYVVTESFVESTYGDCSEHHKIFKEYNNAADHYFKMIGMLFLEGLQGKYTQSELNSYNPLEAELSTNNSLVFPYTTDVGEGCITLAIEKVL